MSNLYRKEQLRMRSNTTTRCCYDGYSLTPRHSCSSSSSSSRYRNGSSNNRRSGTMMILALSLQLVALVSSSSSSYLLDKDTRDDCLEYVDNCSSISSGGNNKDKKLDNTFFLSCPITCSQHLHTIGGIGETTKDPDDNYYSQDINIIVTGGGNVVKSTSIEDLVEGYVTVFVMMPMKDDDGKANDSGMIQYYYELLYHIASIYKYSLQVFLQPLDVSPNAEKDLPKKKKKNKHNDIVGKYIKQHPQGSDKVKNLVLLETTTKQTIPTVINNFVLATKPMAAGGITQDEYEPRIIGNDRVAIYIVSADAKFVEQLISPPIHVLEQRLGVYISQLSYGEL